MGLEVAAGIAVASSVGGAATGQLSQRAQRRQDQIRQRRERIQRIREARIRRAQIENNAAASGAQGSSGAIGGASSISSQLGGEISFLDQIDRQNSRIQSFNSIGSTLNTVGGLAQFTARDFAQQANIRTVGDAAGTPEASRERTLLQQLFG